jgi:hypothetical protein
MNTLPHPSDGPQDGHLTEALSFASIASGRLREVILKRPTLDSWTPVPLDTHGLLRVYDERKDEIQKAVQRRLALMGEETLDEVQLMDFMGGLVPEEVMSPPLRGLSPIYCRV